MNTAWLKKYLALEIYGVIILALLGGVGYKLVTAIRRFAQEKSALQAVVDRKLQLDRSAPYPSPANVKMENENYKDLLDGYNELNEQLRAGQAEPRDMKKDAFMNLVEARLGELRKSLTDARVVYPKNYNFSFERYERALPAQEDIPRLFLQLKIIEELCRALGQIGIAELVSIKREEFEAAPGARPAQPPPPAAPGAAPLFTTQHFQLTLKASEPVVRELLNLLACFPLFTVVTALELKSPDPARRTETPVGKEPAHPRKTDPRERPIVIGKELVEVRLELDVYCFAPSLDFKENARAK